MPTLTRLFRAGLAVFVLLLSAVPAGAAEESLSPAQEKAVEGIIQQYLRENPEIIMEALGILRQRQEAAEAERAKQTLAARRDDLIDDPQTPVAGNADGSVIIVEFFDYQCGYCKRVLPMLQAVLDEHDDVGMAMKEFPVLGEASVEAARAALAVWKIDADKYMPFHNALMGARGKLSSERIDAAVKEVGLDPEDVRAGMDAPWIGKQLQENHGLARELGIQGTPAFVVGDRLIPGAVDRKTLEKAIDAARAADD